MRSKKGFQLTLNKIISIALITIALVLLVSIYGKLFERAEGETAEALCLFSVASRAKVNIPGLVVTPEKALVPFLCKTLERNIPLQPRKVTKEKVMKELGRAVIDCWEEFGAGRIEDVFADDDHGGNSKCFMCYRAAVRKWDVKEEGNIILADDLLQYFHKTPYKIIPDTDGCSPFGGGQCLETCDTEGKVNSAFDMDGKVNYDGQAFSVPLKGNRQCPTGNQCCITDKNPCEDHGGQCYGLDVGVVCGTKSKTHNVLAPTLDCPNTKDEKDRSCCVTNDMAYSYIDYVQFYKKPGTANILTNIEPGKSYAVVFGSPNDCGVFCDIGTALGIGGPAIATGTIGALALVAAPFTAGLSLSVFVVGGSAVAGGTIGYLTIVDDLSEQGIKIDDLLPKDILKDRKINSVYITTEKAIIDPEVGCEIIEV